MESIREDTTLDQKSFSFRDIIGQTPNLILPAGTTAKASLKLAHGVAPTNPEDGDMWTTTAGLFVRINGVTVGPLS